MGAPRSARDSCSVSSACNTSWASRRSAPSCASAKGLRPLPVSASRAGALVERAGPVVTPFVARLGTEGSLGVTSLGSTIKTKSSRTIESARPIMTQRGCPPGVSSAAIVAVAVGAGSKAVAERGWSLWSVTSPAVQDQQSGPPRMSRGAPMRPTRRHRYPPAVRAIVRTGLLHYR